MRTVWVVALGAGGFVTGAAIAGVVAAVVGYAAVREAEVRVREAEDLTPVVVFVRDLPAGHAVTFEDIASRSIPRRLVTSMVVAPDSANYVINQALRAPQVAGDPLRWNAFVVSEEKLDPDRLQRFVECRDAVFRAKTPGSLDALRAQVRAP